MKKINWLILTIFFAGCSSSRITSSWTSTAAAPKKYDKVLVLAISGDPDRTYREQMEEQMTNGLKALGYNAVSSVCEYGPKAFDNMKEDEAIKALYNCGIDAVVTIVLLDKVKERYYQPVYQNNRFWGYYSSMQSRIYTPGYYTTDTRYFWETNLYDMKEWTLEYSAQCQSFEPGSAKSLGREYSEMIIKDMAKHSVIKNQQTAQKAF